MKRILIIGPSPTHSKGGMATVIREIQEDKILNKKYQIDIFESFIDGNKIVRAIYSIFAYILFCFSKKDYDLYHIHAASYGSIFRKGFYVRRVKKWGKKVILHIHGASFMDFYAVLSDAKKKKVINILNSADIVIALSKEWKHRFDTILGLKNCFVLENGINNQYLKECIVPIEQHNNEFVFLGRLGERKGAYDLVNAVEIAVKQNSDIKVYMAGDGEIQKIKAMICQKKLNDNIEVVGWLQEDGKKELLKKTAVLVLPSYNEGLPMAILEGMSTGKAIISTVVGAIPEVISEKNGILIQPGDVQALADALVKCSKDTVMLKSMSRSNIEKIDKKFSMRRMHEKLATYYDKVTIC